MPREYICRLVLDRNHRSMTVVKKDRVIGGICYRPYDEQRFAEIAFCAISTEEQVPQAFFFDSHAPSATLNASKTCLLSMSRNYKS